MGTLEKLTPIDQRPSASERVAERLVSLISSGNIAPGDKLPSENELAIARYPGDVVHIPGNVEHGYDVLEPDSVDLEFYSPVREDFLK